MCDCRECITFKKCYPGINNDTNLNISYCSGFNVTKKECPEINNLGMIFSFNSTGDHIQNCAVEELAELIIAINKSRRGKTDIDNLTEEIGHVMLMCYGLMNYYSIDEKSAILESKDAIDRMLKAKQNSI